MAKTLPWQPTASTAVVAGVNYGGDLQLYALGFRDGAEALFDVVRSSGHSEDMLVYPIVYNLRHSVELLLKQVLRAARQLVGERGDFPDHHQLEYLWNTCEPILKQIWWNSQSYSTVKLVVAQLSEIDPDGEGFRYPVSRKRVGVRSPTLDSDLRHIDLEALVTDTLEVIDILDGADTGIHEYLEARAIDAEMRAEYEAENAEYAAEMRAEYADEMVGDY